MTGMPEAARSPWVRLLEYERDHPDARICCIDRMWHVLRSGGGAAGEVEPQRHLDDLLGRLERQDASDGPQP